MENTEKIAVTSGVTGRISLTIRERNYHRVWPKEGAKIMVDKEILREGYYDPGVAYLFKKGLLVIEDPKFRQELGIDPMPEETEFFAEEDKVVSVVLTDQLLDRYLTKMPLFEFKEVFKNLSDIQRREVAMYAVDHDLINGAKIEYIKELTGFDVLKAITIRHQNEEPVSATSEK